MVYTRYADDITFSSSIRYDKEFLYFSEEKHVWVGKIIEAIEDAFFDVNQNKIRISTRNMRQEVTGVIVNKKTNVRRKYIDRIRGALHAWEKYGEEAAQSRLNQISGKTISIKAYLGGMLAYLHLIKGRMDPVFAKLMSRYSKLIGQVYLAGDYWKFSGILIVYNDKQEEIGTAFIDTQKRIISCNHVAQNAMYFSTWFSPEKKVFCERAVFSTDHDIAFLKPVGQFNFRKCNCYLLNTKDMSIQDTYSFAGFPNRSMSSLMPSVICGKVINIVDHFSSKMYKLDQLVFAGASGSPLFDSDNCVRGIIIKGIGLVDAPKITDENLAVHIKYLEKIPHE